MFFWNVEPYNSVPVYQSTWWHIHGDHCRYPNLTCVSTFQAYHILHWMFLLSVNITSYLNKYLPCNSFLSFLCFCCSSSFEGSVSIAKKMNTSKEHGRIPMNVIFAFLDLAYYTIMCHTRVWFQDGGLC
jgi:hypothetical protein